MIYFYDDLVAKTLKMVKSTYDCADVLNDLNRIEQAKKWVSVSGDWNTANQLDYALRQKYPCINTMIRIASTVPISSSQTNKVDSNCDAVIENLTQDFYGILCDTAIKKRLIYDVKEFIKSVE